MRRRHARAARRGRTSRSTGGGSGSCDSLLADGTATVRPYGRTARKVTRCRRRLRQLPPRPSPRAAPRSPPRPSRARRASAAATRRAGSPPAAISRPAMSASRVRRRNTSPSERACSRRAAKTASASRSGRPATIGSREPGSLARDGEHVVRRVAVAGRQRGVHLVGDPVDPRQVTGLDGRAERDLVRAARRVARLAVDEPVDGHLRHPPPGRELAAGDRDHAARRLVELGLARDVDGLLRVARRDQRAHAGVRARQVAGRRATCRSSRWRRRAGTRRPARRAARGGRRARPRSRCRSCRAACARATAARRSSAHRRPARSRRRRSAGGPRGAA